jgi:hypothetical protein
MGGIKMTIEEKAKEFSENNITCSQDILQVVKMGSKHDHDSFIAGAKWMIDKAAAWFWNQKEEIGISWYDDFEIRFRKAMEE